MPPRALPEQFTPAELELMHILWERGRATVQMVMDRLPPDRRLAYTTVQTTLGVLHRKRKVRRRYENRAYWYEPAVTRDGAARSAVGDLVKRLFDGRPERLVLSMVQNEQLTAEAIRDLQRSLDAALAQRKKES
jgi:predicted transcriptional regulator